MKPIRTYAVVPSLPAPLERLQELARNLQWSWNHATIELFRRLDSDLWESSGHNPVLMLGTIDQAQLEAAATDEGFLAQMEAVVRQFDAYMAGRTTWFSRTHGATAGPIVAYFSAEFGITECLSIFAGGLGVLAGDDLKSASDLGVPMVGVGLLYQQGYFRQYLNDAGWQREAYEKNDFHNLPLYLERRPDGAPLTVQVSYPGRNVTAQVWRAQVGRVSLYLLDANIDDNSPADRDITDDLYGGDLDMRMRQEMMLGIGGYRALATLGLEPIVYHLNEGHAAFAMLERIRWLMQTQGLSFAAAREAASVSLIFTTHTPVPAGNDHFSPEMMDNYFADYIRDMGLSRRDFLALGRENADNEAEWFGMTVLALRLAAHSNAVSALHETVTQKMWQGIWPGVPRDEVPIGLVNNGVHFRSWISMEMNDLYNRYLGPRWAEEPTDEAVWRRMERVPAEELWRTHERRRDRLVAFVRRRLRQQLEYRGATLTELEAADEVLDPGALTIGFARRFATYKRATLLLRDPERLKRLLNHPERPIQIIFSGKAHPQDQAGKDLIRQIVSLSHQEGFRRRLVFVEDYDMAVARYMVEGTDVWLNTPRRPLEASGTSGMKAAANGALSLSTLDGWWDEAWRSHDIRSQFIGWAIGRGEDYVDPAEQDQLEAEALYELLEEDVVPNFYDRGADGLPRQWIARMKSSIEALSHSVNSHRMVQEYVEGFYLPAAARYRQLIEDDGQRAKELADWRERVRQEWPQVRIRTVDTGPTGTLHVGSQFKVRTRVFLGHLRPEDVSVQLYMGQVDPDGEIIRATATDMSVLQAEGDGHYLLEAEAVPCRRSGLHGYTIRVLPCHPDVATGFLPGYITWAASE